MLCGAPVHAAQTSRASASEAETMPASWLDPIRVPEAASVQAVFRYDKAGRNRGTLRRSQQPAAASAVCGILNSLKAGEVVLNVPEMSFIPADRAPGDVIYELRYGDAMSMRYYVDTGGQFIISQRVEQGMMYQGMKFTGGNVNDVIARLNAFSDYEDSGDLPFGMPVALKSIELYNYRDMTCTRILGHDTLRRAEALLDVAVDPGETAYPVYTEDYGPQFSDLHDMTLVFRDGTDLTARLYEDGVLVLETDEALNAPTEKSYYPDRPVYDQLVNMLRASQSACAPAWLYSMDEHRISSVTLTAPDGGQSRTFYPGEKQFDQLLDTARGVTVEPLSLAKLSRRSYPEGAYAIRFDLNDDTVYTMDYGTEIVEVEATGKDFVASYKLARGYSNDPRYLESLLA